MPRKPKRGDSGAELRQYLLDEAIEFREFISHPTVRGPDGRPMRSPQQTWLWDGWSFSVDALANGESYRLRRYDLPDWSVERFAGDLNDEFELTESNELRPLP